MPTHADFLAAVTKSLGAPLTLVSRLVEPRLRIPESTAAVFLPDLHLTTERAIERFQKAGFFFRPESRKTLKRFLEGVEPLSGFQRIQLGDRYDLWREGIAWDDAPAPDNGPRPPRPADADLVTEIRAFHGDAVARLAGPSWEFLAGNHDDRLNRALKKPGADAEPFIPLGAQDVAEKVAPVLVLHGHQFDSVEKLPDWLQLFGIDAFANLFPEGSRNLALGPPPPSIKAQRRTGPSNAGDLRPLSTFQEIGVTPKVPLPSVRNESEVDDVTGGVPFNVQRFPSLKKFFVRGGGAPNFSLVEPIVRKVRDFAREHDRSIPKLVVIGHTHTPRIVTTFHLDGETPFVLADCGAWVERSAWTRVGGGAVEARSAHVGVLAGNDIRIYQLPEVA